MYLNELTEEELIAIAEFNKFPINSDDEKEVLISKISEGLEYLLEKNGYVDVGDEDTRTYCAFCKKKITSEEILPDGYEEMFSTMAIEYCESCYEKYEE